MLLGQLTEALCFTDAAQSLCYAQEGLHLAQQLQFRKGEALLLNDIGSVYLFKEDLPQATSYYQQAVRRAGTVPKAGRYLTLALVGLGRVAAMQNDYSESQRYFTQALHRMQQHLHPVLPKDISMALNGLGGMYYYWMSSEKVYPDSVRRLSLYYNRLVLNRVKHGPPTVYLAVALNAMGRIHQLCKHYDSAEYYHRTSLRVSQLANHSYGIMQAKMALGETLVEQHRATESLSLLKAAVKEAKLLNLPDLQAFGSIKLAAVLAQRGQGLAAYHLARAGQDLLDSLQRIEKKTNLAQLRVEFDTEQERSRVRDLTHRTQMQALQARKQQQYFWWLTSFLLAVAIGLVVAGGLAWRLRRQRAELAVTRAEQDRLYALIAHDLRSPVVAFSGLADLLTTYVERQDTTRLLGLGGRVRQAAESLRDMLDNLLNWALSQRGELQPVLRLIPVAELFSEIARLYQPTADMAQVELLLATANAGQVVADRQMTLTILRNLVSNAIHATPAGGRITVRAMASGPKQLLLEVSDTGQGIDAETLARIMSGRVLHTPTNYRGRAGLGLRLSRLFAKAQSGQLALYSTVGLGTTATLTLPCQ